MLLKPTLDVGLLVRLSSLEPPIDPEVIADTLCDGELLAVVLNRWIICDFRVHYGVLLNSKLRPLPPERVVVETIRGVGIPAAESTLSRAFDFELINDPACPQKIMLYILNSFAFLWEAQARSEFPDRDVRFELEWCPTEGMGAYAISHRSNAM